MRADYAAPLSSATGPRPLRFPTHGVVGLVYSASVVAHAGLRVGTLEEMLTSHAVGVATHTCLCNPTSANDCVWYPTLSVYPSRLPTRCQSRPPHFVGVFTRRRLSRDCPALSSGRPRTPKQRYESSALEAIFGLAA